MPKNDKRITTPPTLSVRPTQLYEMPLADGVAILHPERATLVFGGMSIDVGTLCYLRREDSEALRNLRKRHGRKVDIHSLDPQRANLIRRFIVFFSEMQVDAGYAPSTVHTLVRNLIYFMDWADAHGHRDVFSEPDHTYAGFRKYVEHLRHRVDTNQVSQKTGASRQFSILRIIERFTSLHDIHRGVRLIDSMNIGTGTVPPSERDLGRFEGLCDALFKGHCELVLENRPFPYKLSMPKSLGWSRNYVWHFPITSWCVSPDKACTLAGNAAYDFEHGRIATVEEVRKKFTLFSNAIAAVRHAKLRVANANHDVRHPARIAAAVRAHNAFVMLFLGQTGLNNSVAFALPWGQDYKIGTSQQGFREIKWRAGGKIVSVVIRNRFLPLFAKFIKIRTYLLNGREFDRLFINFGWKHQAEPGPFVKRQLETFLDILVAIDPTMPRIRSRKLRAAKQDFHIRNDEPTISARIMGHSEDTARKHYTAGSEAVYHEEMSRFLSKVEQAAINKTTVIAADAPSENDVSIHVGSCGKFKVPNPVAKAVPVSPDCTTLEGCLFCDKHRVHAHEQDVRRLVSCAFVVQQTTYLPGAQEYFQPVLDRIGSILEEVGSYAGMVQTIERVTREIEEDGALDPYWAEKWTQLNNLELIA